MTSARLFLWHLVAGATMAFGARYLIWRWQETYTQDAPIFWTVILLAEFLTFCGLILFYYDIWDEGDTPRQQVPVTRDKAHLIDTGSMTVDVFVTSFDEDLEVIQPSLAAAKTLNVPKNFDVQVHLLDDGNRPHLQKLCDQLSVRYHARPDRAGFKAGNVREAMLHSDGDFIVICDADTILFPNFLRNTLGYFHDPKVSWVQTPHWFYDLPNGRSVRGWLRFRLGRHPLLIKLIEQIFGKSRAGQDPFMNNPELFFDVIQRRRNRHNASFSCGAGSIFRREALLAVALGDAATEALKLIDNKSTHSGDISTLRVAFPVPLKFHISEDILTSIYHHKQGWKSVYHPQVEARMLSPQDLSAWLQQRMRYATGTFDIFLHQIHLFRSGLNWKVQLHYLATFWSYFSVLWFPILYFAPAVSLATGWAPVSSYSWVFFSYLLPFLILNEISLLVGCKGFNTNFGRIAVVALWPYNFLAFFQALLRRKMHFLPTPKTPNQQMSLRILWPHFVMLMIFAAALCLALWRQNMGDEAYTRTFIIVNVFWLSWNASLTLYAVHSLRLGERRKSEHTRAFATNSGDLHV